MASLSSAPGSEPSQIDLSLTLRDLANAYVNLRELSRGSTECLVQGGLIHPPFQGGYLIIERPDNGPLQSVRAYPTRDGAVSKVFLELARRGNLDSHADSVTGLNRLMEYAQNEEGHTFRLSTPDATLTIAPLNFARMAEVENEIKQN